jgi:peptidoglycan hydrolase-like protein with peptidoglycan-binding domain
MSYDINTRSFSKHIISVAALSFALALVMSTPEHASAATLYRQLDLEDTGSDVSSLQTYLAGDASIYPERLITGYFGMLTHSAVARFQSRNGIAAVGRVGPITLAALNIRMGGVVTGGSDVYSPTISNVAVSTGSGSATVSWGTSELAYGVVYYSTSPIAIQEGLHSVSVIGASAVSDTNLRSSQSIGITGLQRDTTYHYMIQSTDQMGNVSVSWPTTFRVN